MKLKRIFQFKFIWLNLQINLFIQTLNYYFLFKIQKIPTSTNSFYSFQYTLFLSYLQIIVRIISYPDDLFNKIGFILGQFPPNNLNLFKINQSFIAYLINFLLKKINFFFNIWFFGFEKRFRDFLINYE